MPHTNIIQIAFTIFDYFIYLFIYCKTVQPFPISLYRFNIIEIQH